MKKKIILIGMLLCFAGVVCAAHKKHRNPCDTQAAKNRNTASKGLSPVEARLERKTGKTEDAEELETIPTRIENARRASRELRKGVAGAQQVPSGSKVKCVKVKKCGCSGTRVKSK